MKRFAKSHLFLLIVLGGIGLTAAYAASTTLTYVSPLQLVDNTTNTRLYISNSGNMGIGTTSPLNKLEVTSPIIGGSVSVAKSQIYARGSDNGYGVAMGALNSPAGAYVQTMLNDGTGGIPLYLNPNGGNVGIRENNPSATLDVNGTTLFRSGSQATGAGLPYQMKFGYANSDTYDHYIRTRHQGDAAEGNAFDFYTSDGTQFGTFPTNAILGLTIDNGKVGIGTTSPQNKLDVNGTVSINGGNNIVYRCTTAGALPVGALTINTTNCGVTADTGLRVK